MRGLKSRTLTTGMRIAACSSEWQFSMPNRVSRVCALGGMSLLVTLRSSVSIVGHLLASGKFGHRSSARYVAGCNPIIHPSIDFLFQPSHRATPVIHPIWKWKRPTLHPAI